MRRAKPRDAQAIKGSTETRPHKSLACNERRLYGEERCLPHFSSKLPSSKLLQAFFSSKAGFGLFGASLKLPFNLLETCVNLRTNFPLSFFKWMDAAMPGANRPVHSFESCDHPPFV